MPTSPVPTPRFMAAQNARAVSRKSAYLPNFGISSGGGGICSVAALPRGNGRTTQKTQHLIILARQVISIAFLVHQDITPLRAEGHTELPTRVPYRDLDASSRSPSIDIIARHSKRFDFPVSGNDRVFCTAECSPGRTLIGNFHRVDLRAEHRSLCDNRRHCYCTLSTQLDHR